MNIHLVSLGCARNLVDSEVMTGKLREAGCIPVQEPEDADVIIVNTCSFIEAAANESIDTILALAALKKTGACSRLIVTGCLPERYREDIVSALPEVDVFLGTGAYDRIIEAVQDAPKLSACVLPDPDSITVENADVARDLTTGPVAYLKIAEGCSRRCSYCIIPRLRGRQKSRSMADIVTEAERLAASGVRELTLVSQDTTAYGQDLEGPADFSRLLERLSRIPGDTWIRFLYGHPESITDAVIRTVADHPRICPYFDIPVQHASDSVLKRMGRHYGRKELLRLFENIRATVPEASLRTTVIVGFPGETDADFDLLLSFVREIRFDHLGVFIYSDADDLPSHHLPDPVPAAVARRRHNRLMSDQKKISTENNQRHLEKIIPVLVESAPEKGVYMGRTRFQAPEVDGVTIIHADQLEIGDVIRVRITDTLQYDLIGVPHE
ncbi:MAG: 30S ribosomal protein S12 methylthiotransferase RimO [Desulfatirhabdiaceae bacterium]|nr:30S ribosomal protein S12 methylthiotransferase RimO [Desulfatirhabdiaceae bacterium]